MAGFEFDNKKSENNKKKHGIDFIKAQLLWQDANLIEIPAKTSDEARFVIIGRIADKYWSGIITYRKEKIRIISVRRARAEEVEIYES
ncbi:MAG: BrnT family toxin [Candidatus Omnitrophota bacterium]